jgi:hypothetical protein
MSTPKTVSWAVAGPTRTLIQAGPSYAFVEAIDAFLYDMSDRQYAALVVLLTMLLGFIQAVVENGLQKAILRKVPPTEVPVVDDNDNVI